jgi:hypothetical protein
MPFQHLKHRARCILGLDWRMSEIRSYPGEELFPRADLLQLS